MIAGMDTSTTDSGNEIYAEWKPGDVICYGSGRSALEDRNAQSRECHAAMIAPSVRDAAPRFIPKRPQRRTALKYFGVRGFYQ